MKRLVLALAFCAASGFAAAVAYAQAVVAPAPSLVDITPITNSLIPAVGSLLGLLLSGFVGFGIRWLNSKTHLVNAQKADALQQIFSEQIAHMMAYGESVAKASIPQAGRLEIDNAFIRRAVEYGVKAYPNTIGKADPEAIARAIIARLPSGPMTATAEAITAAKAGKAAPVAPAAPAPASPSQ